LLKILPNSMRVRVIANNRWLKAIHDADIAFAVSGGDSFSDIYGMGRFFYVLLPQILVLMLGRRLCLLPQTIGPFDGRLSRMLARLVMQHAEKIYAKVRFCYDLGFLVEPRRPKHMDLGGVERGDRSRPLVGLNISGLLLIGGYDRNNTFELKVDYRKLVESVIHFLVKIKGFDVLLVPHVFGISEESDTAAIASICEQFGDQYAGSLFRVCGTYDQNEIKHIIGLCDFFIGARMHACIAALSQAIPSIAIAYSRKFVGVLESIGVGHLVVDPRLTGTEDILRLVDASLNRRAHIRAQLEKTMPSVREALLSVAAELA
jgi:colanic acid/amylovoran biosynthesis protein